MTGRDGILIWAVFASVFSANQSTFAEETRSRSVTFELTFAQKDLEWLGDPASPAAMVYIKPGAMPIATDGCIRTLTSSDESLVRQYMREARVVDENGQKLVYAFTREREKVIGTVDKDGRFVASDLYTKNRDLLPSWPADAGQLAYDAKENALYYNVEITGPRVEESLDFLPLALVDENGTAIAGRYAIAFVPDRAGVVLTVKIGEKVIKLAEASLPKAFRRDEVELGSFDNSLGTYLPEAAYRPGADASSTITPSVTFTIPGELTSAIKEQDGKRVLVDVSLDAEKIAPTTIAIDGRFDDWRNVTGVDDPRGDVAPYLEYIPDVDLLEFKVAHDDKHIYLYARVAGQVGRSHPDGGRGYFYAYMDVDQNPGTGFLPTRDDDCYFGVEIGDDCEVQFEFVNDVFRKTFYGFCGLGGDADVVKQLVTIGKSQYGRLDENGKERAHYKSEYIYRDGKAEITEDLKLGTSDTIHLAVSPDGREVEVVSTYAGFLKNREGKPTVGLGQTIDVAAGMESDSKAYLGKSRWGADSTSPIRGYKLTPSSK